MLKEKLGICPYEENYYGEEIIKIKDDIEESFNKLLDESEEEFFKELDKELGKGLNKKLNKETSDEELIEIINPKKDEDMTDWYDKNKFKKIVTTIDNNKFNHINKVGKFKFNNINNLVDSIKNNTISEALAKQKLNALNKIKKAEIKGKCLINSQKILLSLFDELLKAIFNNNNNKDLSENVSENVSENESENESDDEQYYEIKQLNNQFKTIGETKSLKEQIEILKTKDFLDEYWHFEYHGNKELNFKIFKTKAAYILNDLDEQLFEKIYFHTFAALVDKLMNTIGKEENKTIIDNIEKNKDKSYEQDEHSKFVIQATHKHGDLLDAIKIILNFSEVLSLDLT